MLRLTLFEYFTRTLPEGFLLMLGMSVLCNVKIERKKYICESIILSILEYLVRSLPINYGVHTILNIMIMILLVKKINNTDMIVSIRSGLIITILLFICEALNMILLNCVLGDRLEELLSNDVLKNICGIPSLIFYILIIIILYYFKKKRDKHANYK